MAEIAPAQVRELVQVQFALKPDASPVVKAAHKSHAEGDSEKSAKILAGEVVPYSDQDIEIGNVQRFGSRVETGTKQGQKEKATSGPDKRRHDDSKAAAEKSRDYLEKGDKTKIQAELKSYLQTHHAIIMESVMEAVNASRGTLTVDAAFIQITDGIASSDRFRGELQTLFNERLDPSKKVDGEAEVRAVKKAIKLLEAERDGTIDKQSVVAAKGEVTAATTTFNAHTDAIKYAQSLDTITRHQGNYLADSDFIALTKISDVTDEINNIEGKYGGGRIPKGAQASPQENQDAERVAVLKGIKDKYQAAEGRKDLVDKAQTAITGIENNDPSIKADLTELQTKQAEYKQLLDKFNSGSEVITPQRKAEIEAEIMDLKIDLADAESTYDANKAKAARDITHMVGDAAGNYMEDTLKGLTDAYELQAIEAKTAEAQVLVSAQAKLANGFRNRHATRKLQLVHGGRLDVGIRRNLHIWRPDKAAAEEVIGAYLSGGNEAVGRRVANRMFMLVPPHGAALPPPGVLPPPGSVIKMRNDTDLMNSYGLTPAEIGALRSQMGADANGVMTQAGIDKYFQTAGTELTTKAISDYLRSGGHINKSVTACFTDTPVGTEIITNAIARSKEQNEAINKLAGKDITGSADKMRTYLKEHKGQAALMILALLLGLAPLGVWKAVAGAGAAGAKALA